MARKPKNLTLDQEEVRLWHHRIHSAKKRVDDLELRHSLFIEDRLKIKAIEDGDTNVQKFLLSKGNLPFVGGKYEDKKAPKTVQIFTKESFEQIAGVLRELKSA